MVINKDALMAAPGLEVDDTLNCVSLQGKVLLLLLRNRSPAAGLSPDNVGVGAKTAV
jgi:hypothetical protein